MPWLVLHGCNVSPAGEGKGGNCLTVSALDLVMAIKAFTANLRWELDLMIKQTFSATLPKHIVMVQLLQVHAVHWKDSYCKTLQLLLPQSSIFARHSVFLHFSSRA